ncbi:MAG: choice-of-anchor Q domain-containing protein [Pseudobdellovibrionaceae bacterium]
MKMKFSAKWLLLILLGPLTLISYQNCGSPKNFSEVGVLKNTTGVGNPMTTYKIVASICEVIHQCHPQVSLKDCEAQVQVTAGFAKPMGLSNQFDTLALISTAESSGSLVGSSAQSDLCVSQIQQTTCSDPKAQTAYNSLATQPFAGSVNLLSGESCEKVVTPVSQYQCQRKVFLQGAAANSELKPAVSSQGLTYSISPALPAGLSLNSSTGVISGSPLMASPMTTYTVTANGPGGAVTNQIEIKTADGFQVNDLGDAGNTGGSNCRTLSGTCTLRAAISAAIASTGSKAILLPPGTISLSSVNPLAISKGLEIYGDCESGTVVDGLDQTQILQVTAGPTQIENLTLQRGYVEDDSGAALNIKAMSGTFTTTLKNFKVLNNKIGGCPSGTGICEAAGVFIYGQSSSSQARINLSGCEIRGNKHLGGGWGGGLSAWSNTQLTIQNCTFADNQSLSYGAGLATRGGNLIISQSLFLRNQGRGEGGGIFIDHGVTTASSLTNVTMIENKSDDGGGIYVGGGSLSILNSTFTNNTASSPFYGGALATQVTIQLENSLFAKNLSNGSAKHCTGSFVSRGSNLSDGPAIDCGLNQATDIVNTDPLLASLQDNGGATQTLALLSGSPAMDKGNAASCPAVDQREAARLVSGKCDIGAFEAP